MNDALDSLRDVADANQRKASDPRASAWVSANAGTGKTTVLVNRVLRLLLEGAGNEGPGPRGVRPERILCLTYTKTAAAEMENRLLDTLADWATFTEEALAERLARLMGRAPDADDIASARRLFATVLETRGGLKIHTIHAFCQRILERFPVEAGVPAGFSVLEDLERRALRDAAIDAVLDEAAGEGGPLGEALAEVIANAAEERFRDCVDAMLARQEDLLAMQRIVPDPDRLGEAEELALRGRFGVRAGASEEAVRAEMAAVLDDDELAAAAAALAEGGGKADAAHAAALDRARLARTREARIEALCEALLTKDRNPFKSVAVKAVRAESPEIVARLEAARDALHALDLELTGIATAAASGALLRLADAIVTAYERAKAARAALDYDDLIARTVALLDRSGAAAWVLYKLDGGVDHVLVDEAQDTSPLQWRVIERLAEEFFAGEGAREGPRTLFAVGDEKQSIYSFQGADPAEFGRQGEAFARKAGDAALHWARVPLNVSFRSTECVLASVDTVFRQPQAFEGLSWQDAEVLHYAYRRGHAGLVEIWPLEEVVAPPEVHAFEPFAEPESGGGSPEAALASRLADAIRDWLAEGETVASTGKPIAPGDILILVRRRNPFTRPMIRALKARGLPVAGADRMVLTEQLAVMDLMALGEVLLQPDDDLSLATVLKSPLFGFDDDALFQLAHGRRGSLWRELRDRAGENPGFAAAHERLAAWLGRADRAPPYEFFAGVLEENGMAMRRAMLERLGPDAADALDEFLNLALRYDAASPPSLQGFLDQVRRGAVEVKRDMEQGRDEVRIMTVHAAKGLEAPIVILPDTCGVPPAGRAPILRLPRRGAPPDAPDHLVWAIPGSKRLPAVQAAREGLRRAELEEYNRLLYVAMTRAKDRLYVCGWRRDRAPSEGNWYDLVRGGLASVLEEMADADRSIWRYRSGEGGIAPPKAAPTPPPARDLPDWAREPARPEAPAALPVAPSALLRASEERPGGWPDQDAASPLALAGGNRFLRGDIAHALLQHLPAIDPAGWEGAARAYVERRGAALPAAERAALAEEVLAILRHPEYGALFSADSLAEAPVAARLEGRSGRVDVAGQVDRLVVRGDDVLILDYKTNRPPPEAEADVAPAYMAQMAGYRAVMRRLFPGKAVVCALLWTAGPRLMRLSDDALDAWEIRILDRGGSLDAPRPRP